MSIALTESIILLRKVRAGDKDALDLLFRRYKDRLLRIVRARLGREMRGKIESMDVLQEVLLKAMEKIDTFEPASEGALLHWFSTRIERKIHDLYDRFHAAKRDLRHERALDAPASGEDGETIASEPEGGDMTPSRIIAMDEETRRLESALDSLLPEQKEVVILKMYEDMTFEEIGAVLNKSAEAARKCHARAMIKLSSILGTDA